MEIKFKNCVFSINIDYLKKIMLHSYLIPIIAVWKDTVFSVSYGFIFFGIEFTFTRYPKELYN